MSARFYTRELELCRPKSKDAFLCVEDIPHPVPGRIGRQGWLLSTPTDVRKFKNRKEMNAWMAKIQSKLAAQ